MTAHSEVVSVSELKVWNATLRISLHHARFNPFARADVLHLNHVMFDFQTAVVEWRCPRQVAAVLIHVEYFQRSLWF